MMRVFIQHVRFVLLLLTLAGVCEGSSWGQDVLVPSTSCATSKDRRPGLDETVNLINAQLFEAAECSARELTRSQPDSADAHYLLAFVLNRRDKADDSLKEYTTAAKYRIPSPNDLAVVALDYALLKDYMDAEKWMTQALIGDSKNALYWYYLGRIRYTANAFDKARAAFEQALRLAPNDTRDLYNLGLTYEGLGEAEHAASFYRQAIASEQGSLLHDAQPYYDLGSLLSRQNESAEALSLLQRAATLDPRNPAIHEQLAKAEEQMGQLAASKTDLELAVALAPNVGSLHFELGRVYQKLRMTVEAKQQFDLCSKMTETHSSIGSDSLDFTRRQ
jgi:tetratricopeptide (TPR) repeat protein